MWPGRLGKASWTRLSWEGSWGTSLAGDLSDQVLLARRHSGLDVQSSAGTTEACRRVAWSDFHFLNCFLCEWSRGSHSTVPRRAAAASPMFFLTGHLHGPHSDLLHQIFKGGPGPGFEQALLVISMHVTAWKPLLWRMDDRRRDLENVYYKSLCLTNDWPEGPGWISNLSKIKLVVVIIKTQVSWLCQ